MRKHYNPRPSAIVQRYKFHTQGRQDPLPIAAREKGNAYSAAVVSRKFRKDILKKYFAQLAISFEGTRWRGREF